MRFELAPPQDRFENDDDPRFPPRNRSRLSERPENGHPFRSSRAAKRRNRSTAIATF